MHPTHDVAPSGFPSSLLHSKASYAASHASNIRNFYPQVGRLPKKRGSDLDFGILAAVWASSGFRFALFVVAVAGPWGLVLLLGVVAM